MTQSLFIFFRSEINELFCISQRADPELGQPPTCPKRDLETQTTYYGPQTWRRGLYRPSKFGLMSRALRGEYSSLQSSAVCEKHLFFAVQEQNKQAKPEPCVGFNTAKGKACFIFCFPIS